MLTLMQLKTIYFTISAWFDQNELLWDLGMDVSSINNDTAIRNKIKSYYKEFDLVLIAERFDESLIVMKNYLCWDMEDILYLKVIINGSTHLLLLNPDKFQFCHSIFLKCQKILCIFSKMKECLNLKQIQLLQKQD